MAHYVAYAVTLLVGFMGGAIASYVFASDINADIVAIKADVSALKAKL